MTLYPIEHKPIFIFETKNEEFETSAPERASSLPARRDGLLDGESASRICLFPRK